MAGFLLALLSSRFSGTAGAPVCAAAGRYFPMSDNAVT